MNLVYHSQRGRLRRREENRKNLIVRSGKSEAEVTNNRISRWTYCTIEANYTDRHEASRGLSAIAELFVRSWRKQIASSYVVSSCKEAYKRRYVQELHALLGWKYVRWLWTTASGSVIRRNGRRFSTCTVWVEKNYPSWDFLNFCPNGWEFLRKILHGYCMFTSTPNYTILFNYL